MRTTLGVVALLAAVGSPAAVAAEDARGQFSYEFVDADEIASPRYGEHCRRRGTWRVPILAARMHFVPALMQSVESHGR